MKFICWAALFVAWLGSDAKAASLITGDVSFSSSTGLYTYNYVIDVEQLPPGGIHEFGVLSNSLPSGIPPLPAMHAEPEGWNFVLAVGGWTQPQIQVFGTFWMWEASFDIDPVGGLTFSFSTTRAPDVGLANNYILYSGTAAGQDNLPFAYGRIVGPDIAVAVVPEPASMLLWLTGGLMFGWLRKRCS